MLVKNEARRVEAALAPILDQLAEVVVFDTGSSDGTQDLLRERLQIEPIPAILDAERCGSHAELRNRGLSMLHSPWCMTLDADERLDPDGLKSLRKNAPADDVGGLFLRWHNLVEGGEAFDDYKCAIFRRGFRKVGLIHDNVQPSLRLGGTVAEWSDAVVLEHRPEARKNRWKRQTYRNRLLCAMQLEPGVPRYPWFAGYAAMREGRSSEAHRWLTRAAESRHPLFPVERLNARVALVALCAAGGDIAGAQRHLRLVHELRKQVVDDFEVRINRWLEPWLERAAADLRDLRVPRFAC